MIHLACVVDDVEQAQEACAHRLSQEVVVTVGDELACVCRQCDEPVPSTEPTALLDHDELVRGLMATCSSVVPFRYGTLVEDPDAVRAELAPRAGEFRELLEWLRGRVELALRAAPAAPAVPPPATDDRRDDRSGASYLRSLRAGREQDALIRLHRTLAACAVAAVAEPDDQGGIKASYLVDGQEVDHFCRQLDRTVTDAAGVGPVSLTGPWAPYTFAATFAARPLVAAEDPGGDDRA